MPTACDGDDGGGAVWEGAGFSADDDAAVLCEAVFDPVVEGVDPGDFGLGPDNNTLHTEPRAARVFLLASRSPRPGERCRYPAQSNGAFERTT